ncbi:MAG TPA: BadF/BadG/BcrA/BcrD ATPase family protein [Trebonia sp.]|nr:BadF/BadG/BcrA/BcrD ATPase family protein [Trebonia sp.]
MTAAVLAIDGGNSKTDLALVAPDGTVLAALRGQGASQEDYGIDGATAILGGLVRQVAAAAGLGSRPGPVARHTRACLAGCDLPSEEESLTASLAAQGWSATAVAMNDTFAVLRAGLPDAGSPATQLPGRAGRAVPGAVSRTVAGVAVTCGAGINCVAVGPDGEVARYLALGTLTGDWGGGSGLGRAVMWHAMRGHDGRGPATALGPAVAAHFALGTVADVAIAVHQERLTWHDLTTVIPVLFRVAADGDEVAARLIRRQAEEVAVMAVTALRRLSLPARGTIVVLGGGLLQAGDPLLASYLAAEFAARAPGTVLRTPDVPPVAGAALLGLDYLGLTTLTAGKRLREHYRQVVPAEL